MIPFQQSSTRLEPVAPGQTRVNDPGMRETLGRVGTSYGMLLEKSAEIDEKLSLARDASELVDADNKAEFLINDIFNESQADDFKNTPAYEEKLNSIDDKFTFSNPEVKEKFNIRLAQKKARAYMNIVNKNIERNQNYAIASLNENTDIKRSAFVAAGSDTERNDILADLSANIDSFAANGIISAVDAQKRKEAMHKDFNDSYIQALVDNDPDSAAALLNSGKAKVSTDDRDKFLRMIEQKKARDEKLYKDFVEKNREYNARKTFLSLMTGEITPDDVTDMITTGDLSPEDGNLFIAKLSKESAAMPKTNPDAYLKVVNEITQDDVDVKKARRIIMKANINGDVSDEDMKRLFSYKVMGRDGQISFDAYAKNEETTSWGKHFNLAIKSITETLSSPYGRIDLAASYLSPQYGIAKSIYSAVQSLSSKIEETKPKEEDLLPLAKMAIEEQFMKQNPQYAIRGVPDKAYSKDGTIRDIIGVGSKATADYTYKNGRLVKRGEE